MLLTKSKYLIGLQCPKYLWTVFHKPELIPEPDISLQHRFEQGNLIGDVAKKIYPKGLDLSELDFKDNITKTKEAIEKRKTIFEAGIQFDNCYSRIDILKPVGKNEWDIIEVKSGTKVKDENVHDVSFQKYCCEQFGLKIRKCFLMYVNNDYVRYGRIKPKKLLVKEDISSKVEDAIKGISKRISFMLDIINSDKLVENKIGSHCNKPYACPIEECFSFLPENNVFHLYRGGKVSLELFENEVYAIKDIPDSCKLNSKQEIQRNCEKEKKIHIEKENIKKFLSKIKKPIYYLDFETFSTAVPLYDNIEPYQQIPFQYSLHVDDDGLKHFEFLCDGKKDPRKEFLDSLKEKLGSEGSIVTYNASFEVGILKNLAEEFQEGEWVNGVVSRVVDLLIPFREFYYYNPKQKGSASLKKVLPAICGKDYSGLDIGDGGTASVSFLKIDSSKDKEKVREDLLKYCCLDTMAMVDIVEALASFTLEK